MDASGPTAAIRNAYSALLDPQGGCDWLIVGATPSGRLELLSQGAQGLTQLRTRLVAGRSLHGLLKVEGRVLFWSQIPDELTGVKRARALVQARHVANIFPRHDATVTFAAPGDLEPALVAIKLFHQQSTNSPTIRVESPHSFEGRRPSIPETLNLVSAPRRSLEKTPIAQPTVPPKVTDQPAHPPHLMTIPRGASSRERSDSLNSRTSSRSVSALQRPIPPPATSPQAAGYLSASAASPTSAPRYLSPSSIPLNGLAISAVPSPPVSPAYPPPASPRSDQLPSPASPPGILDSAAAAMLVSSPSDSSIALSLQEVPIDIGEDELASRRSTMQVFAGEAVPTRRLGANDLRASVYPTESPMTAEPEEIGEPDEPANSSSRQDAKATDASTAPRDPGPAAGWPTAHSSVLESRQIETTTTVPGDEVEQDGTRRSEADEEALDAERAKHEAEEAERRHAVEAAEAARLEAARIEAARIEAEEAARRAEAERVQEEQARHAREAEAQRAEEEARRAEEEEARRLQQLDERRKADLERKERLAAARDSGAVMMEGTVNVQANDSVMWKRRFFRLDRHALTLHKTERASDEVFLIIALNDTTRLTTNPEEALVPHSFKLRLQDGGGVLFYYNTAVETERLVEAVRCALEKGPTSGGESGLSEHIPVPPYDTAL